MICILSLISKLEQISKFQTKAEGFIIDYANSGNRERFSQEAENHITEDM